MAKKSFFSRLMGSDIIDESREEQISNFSFEMEESEEPQFSTPPQTLAIEETEEQEWLPESNYEGQLTVDVYQTKDDVVIQTVIAGVTADDVDITIANDKVTIEGERKRTNDVPIEDYFYQECYWGPFSRSVVLPVDVDVDNVEAKMKDGILTITLPKAAKAKIRKVQIKKSSE
ncbi:MAG: hypothetical protein A3J48_00225 [Candidatus Doudnabacteria bacterium RIFCSPHIGHO2_02_FULL_46_11]|uniref:Uncharacterized protein n=1 Tax=Candidatus Doudnabacteria bacterium RIFCSPHIGHO2_02_FULL_46_11 TaxID=1817832 RepID=A0A1F5P6M7_9BACT|nr:MAG: hypothetical protein A3J48_00225 [Candidatus Doudnabacteria bacterium RIFCSPHIGHO2_02_FULL_46_11]